MDIKRIASALLGFPLVVVILTFGNKYVVDIFLMGIAILAMQEYFNAVQKECKPVRWLGYLSCVFIGLMFLFVFLYFCLNLIEKMILYFDKFCYQ